MKIIALILSAMAGLWWYIATTGAEVPQTTEITSVTPQIAEQKPTPSNKPVLAKKALNELQQRPIPQDINQQLPSSLHGTPPPQSLRVDQNGNLIIEPAVINLFDYYLTAIGEEKLTLIIDRIKHQLASTLQSPALDEALSLLNHYLDYRNQRQQLLNEHNNGQLSIEQLTALKSQIRALRANLFGSNDMPLFEHLDQYDDHMLARQAIATDNNLSQAQKQQALDALSHQAPQWLSEQQQADQRINHYLTQKRQLDSHSQQQLAEQQFGPQAAERLAQLQQKRQIWQQKLDDYHQQLSLILINEDSQLRQQQIAELRAQYFDQTEQIRVDAIDRQKFNL